MARARVLPPHVEDDPDDGPYEDERAGARILKHGETLRVSLAMMDDGNGVTLRVPLTLADDVADTEAEPNVTAAADQPSVTADDQSLAAIRALTPPRVIYGRLVDAFGSDFWVGHRPGHVFAADSNSEVTRLRDQTDRERDEITRLRANAWRDPPAAQPLRRDAQSPTERVDASGRPSGSSRSPNAPTVTVAADDLRAAADQARADRHARDMNAWRG